MAFQKIVAPTPKELFISQLVRQILSGELKAGEKLPTERELAEMMDINRSTAHSGLEELQHMGLVRMEPRRGNFVADYTRDGDFNTLTAIAKYGDGDFDVAMRISLVELRNSIVGGALIRLAKTATSEDLNQLRSMMEKHRAAEAQGTDITTAAMHLLEFNTELVRLSGNTMYLLILNSFSGHNLPLWERCVKHWGMDSPAKQEEIIIDMLEKGKGHDAAMYLENMFESYMEAHSMKR